MGRGEGKMGKGGQNVQTSSYKIYNWKCKIQNSDCSLKNTVLCPDWVAQLVGVSYAQQKYYGFNSQSGHVTRLQVQSPAGVHTGATDLYFSLTLMFSFLSLSPFLSL